MNIDIADELLTTTRMVRRHMDLTRPVPLELVEDCLRIAIQAPSGSNSQGWRWVIVTEPDKRKRIAEIYWKAFDLLYRPQEEIRLRNMKPERAAHHRRVVASATALAEKLAEVPVLVVPCLVGRPPPGAPNGLLASFYGSIYPAVWSFQLALRSRGVGSALSTLHLTFETEAAQVLGIPASVTQTCLVSVSYPRGEPFRPATRRPLEEVAYYNAWNKTR